MDVVDYLKLDAMNWSTLKHALVSARHLRAAMDAEPTPSTPAQALGTAVHVAVLEPDRWEDAVAVSPKVDRRTKSGKAAWTEHLEASAGRLVITEEQADTARRMGDAVRSHPAARGLLATGEAEVTRTWEVGGRPAKGRIDWLDESFGLLVDLKTTRDPVDPDTVARTVARYSYHAQLEWYARGAGSDVTPYLMLVESSPPHDVAVYEMDPATRAHGAGLVERAVETWLRAEESSDWPGVAEDVQRLTLPGWVTR